MDKTLRNISVNRNILRAIPYVVMSIIVSVTLVTQKVDATVPGINAAISVNTSGIEPNNNSGLNNNAGSAISQDGRFIVLTSSATNIVTTPSANGKSQVYVRDRLTNATSLVSQSSGGAIGNKDSDMPSISEDGRYIVFESEASNLVSGDTNNNYDVFIRDTTTSTTTLVSKSSAGTIANYGAYAPDVSADGKYVVFGSDSTNLLSGYTISGPQIFQKNMSSGTVTLISQSAAGNPANASTSNSRISCEGRFIIFQSYANNLMTTDTTNPDQNKSRIYIVDMLQPASPTSITGNTNANVAYGALSCNGDYIGFTSDSSNVVSGDTNGLQDSFVYNRINGTITRVSTDSSGSQSTGGGSSVTRVSNDGKYAVFESGATNLVSGDTNNSYDVFLKNLQSGTVQVVSKDSSGTLGNAFSGIADISSDGRYTAYTSCATNLLAGFGTYCNVLAAQTGAENDY